MAGVPASGELHFEAPGPGTWTLDAVHHPRPVTRYLAETNPPAFASGTRDFAVFYGMLMDGMQTAYVNGFSYGSTRPAPPEEIPQRLQRAQDVFEGKLWRQQLREWDETVKPASIAAHLALQAVDPEALGDSDLASYLGRCRAHHAAMMAQHMRFTGAAMVPTGDFLALVGDWTGQPQAELLGLLRGAAPVSGGRSGEFSRLVTTLRQDATATALLEAEGAPERVLSDLRSLGGDSGPAVSAYLDLVGHRLLDGFDISDPTALEMPDALLRSIRISVTGSSAEDLDLEERIAKVREAVPPQHRAQFDDLLAEARLTYRLRDERGVYSDIWAAGLMRRAVLAAGRRLAERGRLHEAEHLVDAGFDEMTSLLADSPGPSADELAARSAYRASHSAMDAPPFLGPPPIPPPDPSGLPPAAARMMRATAITMAALFGSSEAGHEEKVLHGLAASRGVYEGLARRVSGPREFDKIVQGDVLVTEATTEAFNILLPLLGALVTDNGGLLSHSAIVAREYGIPGVVGTREATTRISSGTRVRVDGDAGEVTVLE